MKVGAKWVSKGQICTMAGSSVFGIGCKIYENVFHFIMEERNQTLSDSTMKKVQYFGCLNNAWNQWICNFVSTSVMFVLEQE